MIFVFGVLSHNACPLTQGEIHMSDDAIHDILEQTESDPAFQALFDLFDCSESPIFFFSTVFDFILCLYVCV